MLADTLDAPCEADVADMQAVIAELFVAFSIESVVFIFFTNPLTAPLWIAVPLVLLFFSLYAGLVIAQIYRHLEHTLDLSFVREFVHETYASKGRPSIDPIVFFKLQLVMFLPRNQQHNLKIYSLVTNDHSELLR